MLWTRTDRPPSVVAGLSGLHADRRDAEQLTVDVVAAVRASAGDDVVACTHLVSRPWQHEAVSIEVPQQAEKALRAALFRLPRSISVVVVGTGRAIAGFGAAQQLDGAYEAALGHWDRRQGRAFIFPGLTALAERAAELGAVSAHDVVTTTAIEAIESSHGRFAADAVLVTRGFVRPVYREGRLVVLAGHDDPTQLVPWEVPNPTPCCVDH